MRWNCIITERSSGQIYFVWNDCTNLIGLPEGGRDRFVSDRHNGSWDFSSSLDVVHFFWPTSTIRLWRSVLIFFVLSAERQRTFQSRTPVLNERWPFCKTDRAGNERSGREGRVGTEWSAGEREREEPLAAGPIRTAQKKRETRRGRRSSFHISCFRFSFMTQKTMRKRCAGCARAGPTIVCVPRSNPFALSLSLRRLAQSTTAPSTSVLDQTGAGTSTTI